MAAFGGVCTTCFLTTLSCAHRSALLIDRLTHLLPGRHAFIGIGFQERSASFDFNGAVSDHFKHLRSEKESAKKAKDPAAAAAPALDLGFQEGQKISVSLGGGKPKKKKAASGGGGMGLLAPPPPGGGKPGGLLAPPPGGGSKASKKPAGGAGLDDFGSFGAAVPAPAAAPAPAPLSDMDPFGDFS